MFDVQKEMHVKCTFIDPILGTKPNNKDIYREFIASKAPDPSTIEDEVAAIGVDGVADKGRTVFSRTVDGKPFIDDYQIKGFFKDSCGALARIGGKKSGATESGKITAYKKAIDGLVFVEPRQIVMDIPGEGVLNDCVRPLRAQTAQGERVSLACSEEAPAGTSIKFDILLCDEKHEKLVLEWLYYGRFRGLGQWRNSGKGRFVFDIYDDDGNVIGGNNEVRKR